METCENCGATIGKLETPNVWKEHVVCGACYRKLSSKETEELFQPIAAPRPRQVEHARGPTLQRKYNNFLLMPQIISFILAVFGILYPGPEGGFIFLVSGAIFITLFLAGMIMKANWNQKYG